MEAYEPQPARLSTSCASPRSSSCESDICSVRVWGRVGSWCQVARDIPRIEECHVFSVFFSTHPIEASTENGEEQTWLRSCARNSCYIRVHFQLIVLFPLLAHVAIPVRVDGDELISQFGKGSSGLVRSMSLCPLLPLLPLHVAVSPFSRHYSLTQLRKGHDDNDDVCDAACPQSLDAQSFYKLHGEAALRMSCSDTQYPPRELFAGSD